jgi:hypothetical protein
MTNITEARQEVMREHFAMWEARAEFLNQLAAQEHEEEALLLACCFIETLGNSLYGANKEGSKRTFVRVLVEHGGSPAFAGLHPEGLRRWLHSWQGRKKSALAAKLDGPLKQTVGKLLSEEEMLDALDQYVEPNEREWLKPHLWHATYAAILFTSVRSEAVHNFPAINVTFGLTVFNGEPLPDLDYTLVGPALKAVLAHCREVSLASGKYYGHDFAHLFKAQASGA